MALNENERNEKKTSKKLKYYVFTREAYEKYIKFLFHELAATFAFRYW